MIQEGRGAGARLAPSFAESIGSTPLDYREAIAGDDPKARLMGLALDFMTRVVSAPMATFVKADDKERKGAGGMCVTKVDPTANFDFPTLARDYVRSHMGCDPFLGPGILNGRTIVAGMEDLGAASEPARARLAEELFVPNDIGPVLLLYLLRDASNEVMGLVWLARHVGEASFSAREKAFLRHSVPLLSHSLMTARIARAVSARAQDERLSVLTPRELDVARMAACGARNEEIANSLHVTLGTVKTHLHNAFVKLSVESRVQLAAILHGYENGGLPE